MAEFVTILSTSWGLIRTINNVLTRIQQTREDARALKFLHRQANSFLVTVNEGLVGQDTSPYSGTIKSLEKLLNDILIASTAFVRMSTMSKMINTARTKQDILQLEKRLQFFVNTYLIQNATSRKIDLDAFSRPVTPQGPSLVSLLSDDVRWELMTHGEALTTSEGTSQRIHSWTQAIEQTLRSHASPPGVILPPAMLHGTNVSGSEPGSAQEDHSVDDVIQTPEAVSPAADPPLEQEIEEVPIADSSTSNYQPTDNGRPPSLAAPDWLSVKICVECVLEDRGIVTRFIYEIVTLTKYDKDIAMFLGIFSLSKNFDYVLDVLEAIYRSDPLSDRTGTRVGVLTVATKLVSDLWLTDAQIAKLSKTFTLESTWLSHHHQDAIYWTADTFFESLHKLTKKNEVPMENPINSLSGNKNIRILAVELSKALAVLEYRLRRTDPDGECIRWLARKCARDFLSFPERVEMWVLQTVLQDEMPERVGLRYQLFYKVAKRSKDIHNFSAVRAIMSALQALEQIRIETKIVTAELSSMMNLDVVDGNYDVQNALHKNKPYLQCLEDIFLQTNFSIDNVADVHHQIHGSNYLGLRKEVDDFISQNQLTSPREYAFDGNRNEVVGFVEKCLANVNVVGDVATKVKMVLHQYWMVSPGPGPLFHTEQASLRSVSQSSPRESTSVPPSDYSQASLPTRSHR